MKVTIPGDTPLERLTSFAKRVIAVPKSEIDAQARKYDQKKKRRLRAKAVARVLIFAGGVSLCSPVVLRAAWYKLEGVKRLDKDLYKSRDGIYIETKYCYHYTYGEDAVYNDTTKVIVWDDNEKCDVARLFK